MTQRQLLARPPLGERGWLLGQLRDETTGGVLLLVAAAAALLWANSPWGDAYSALATFEIGPESLHLHLSLATWSADALLAVFFFVVGLELKHELVLGTLSKPAQAAVPVAAAIGGMALPAIIYAVVNTVAADGAPIGWGIPMATDIAFALAILAVVGRRLPVALRAFLLTLAVVDDLGAILVIAVFYSDHFSLPWLLGAVATLVLYAVAQRRRVRSPLVYLPLVVLGWYCMDMSGVHATIAGVAFGLLTRVRPDPGEQGSPADRMTHLVHPISAAICVPLFAFFAAGVDVRSIGFVDALTTPVAVGVIAGLVLGKPIGILAMTWITARFTRASLSPGIAWRDVAAVGLLGGIGFTVALLIAELGFRYDEPRLESAKLAVLAASVVAAALASIALLSRNRHYAAVDAVESADADGDGIPDVYGEPTSR